MANHSSHSGFDAVPAPDTAAGTAAVAEPGFVPDIATTSTQLLERAATCRFLHDLFRPPTREQYLWLGSANARAAWSILRERFAPDLPAALPRPRSFERYHAEYLNSFDVGLPAPPCPLTASHWNKANPVAGVLHEHILFYRQFGLQLRPESLETADHLRHQLEFLQHLSLVESRARARDDDDTAAQCAAAHADFVSRHLTWPAAAAAVLSKSRNPVWSKHWIHLLARSLS